MVEFIVCQCCVGYNEVILFVVGGYVDVQVLLCLVVGFDGFDWYLFIGQQGGKMFVGSVIDWENGGGFVVEKGYGVGYVDFVVVRFKYWCVVVKFVFWVDLWGLCGVIQ